MLTYARLDSPIGRFVQQVTSYIIYLIALQHRIKRSVSGTSSPKKIVSFHSISCLSFLNFIKVSFKMSILKSHRFSYPIWLRFGESYIFLLLGVHCRLSRRSMNRSSWLACQFEMPVGSKLDPCRMCFRKIDECFLGLEV